MKDLVAYVPNESYNNAALDYCMKRNLNLSNLNGKIYFCSSFNFQNMLNYNNSQRKILVTFYQNGIEDINQLIDRIITILLNYPDAQIQNYFLDESNKKTLTNFLLSLNYDNYKINKYDGILSGNSFTL